MAEMAEVAEVAEMQISGTNGGVDECQVPLIHFHSLPLNH
jgi:hypothetical protein